MVGSKGVYFQLQKHYGIDKSVNCLRAESNKLATVKVGQSCTLGDGIKYIVQFNCSKYEEKS